MKFSGLVLAFLFSANGLYSQWTTKSELPALGRNHPVTFTIDGNGYTFTGYYTLSASYTDDGYKYDPGTNTWKALSRFKGGIRGFAVGASYNGKGYLGFGRDINEIKKRAYSY